MHLCVAIYVYNNLIVYLVFNNNYRIYYKRVTDRNRTPEWHLVRKFN